MNQAFNNYSLAIDEIRLLRSIKNLSELLKKYEKGRGPKYILDELAALQQELESLKQARKH